MFDTLSDDFNGVAPVRTKTPQSGSRRRYEIAKTTLHYVQFVKYDVTVSFMAQVLDTVTYLVPQVLDTAS